jgi:hypothetical protein
MVRTRITSHRFTTVLLYTVLKYQGLVHLMGTAVPDLL